MPHLPQNISVVSCILQIRALRIETLRICALSICALVDAFVDAVMNTIEIFL